MELRQIEKIKLEKNIREIGDINELTESIKQYGVIVPLIVDKDGILIAGHRRLAAAKAAGLSDVPVIVDQMEVSKQRRDEERIIENVQRVDLTPMEEAKAFKEYLSKHKCNPDTLSRAISKSIQYIERRLLLVGLIPEAVKALDEKKIEVGHGAILGQMEDKQQKVALKSIIEDKLTVQELAEQLRWMKELNLGDVKVPKKDGQTTLDTACEDLNRSDMSNSTAFRKEVSEYVESQRQLLKGKGMLVFSSAEKLIKEYPKAKRVESWDYDYNKVVKGLTKGKEGNVAVVVDLKNGSVDKDVYVLEPSLLKKEEKVKATKEDNEESEKLLEKSREERLKGRIADFKHELFTQKACELIKPGWGARAVAVHSFPHITSSMEKVLKIENAKLDQEIVKEAKRHIQDDLDLEGCEAVAKHFGFEWEKHFKISEEFLNIFTKDQLIELGKEFKILNKEDIEDNKTGSKQELVDFIMKYWKPGQVPKILSK